MIFVKNIPTEQQIFGWLTQVELFQGLTKEALMPIIESASYKRLSKGDMISYEGKPSSCCVLVLTGEVEVYRSTYLGEEKIFGIFNHYQLVAIAAIFMPHNRFPMTIRAKTDCSVLLIEKQSLLQVCKINPIIMQRLLIRFSTKLYEQINNIDWLTSSSSEQRLASYLLSLCSSDNTYQFILPISRGQLATKLGIRYETLSRLMSSWRKQQIIQVENNRINILNETYLKELTLPFQRSF